MTVQIRPSVPDFTNNMDASQLLKEAINLTIFGMVFVFLFLTILVIATKIMSYIVKKNINKHTGPKAQDEIDEETKSIIEQAIKIHRGA